AQLSPLSLHDALPISAAPGSTIPTPWASSGSCASRRAEPTRTPRRATASSVGRAWRTSAAAAATVAAAALEPLTVTNRDFPSGRSEEHTSELQSLAYL